MMVSNMHSIFGPWMACSMAHHNEKNSMYKHVSTLCCWHWITANLFVFHLLVSEWSYHFGSCCKWTTQTNSQPLAAWSHSLGRGACWSALPWWSWNIMVNNTMCPDNSKQHQCFHQFVLHGLSFHGWCPAPPLCKPIYGLAYIWILHSTNWCRQHWMALMVVDTLARCRSLYVQKWNSKKISKWQQCVCNMYFLAAAKVPLKPSIGEHNYKPFGMVILTMEMVCYSDHLELKLSQDQET